MVHNTFINAAKGIAITIMTLFLMLFFIEKLVKDNLINNLDSNKCYTRTNHIWGSVRFCRSRRNYFLQILPCSNTYVISMYNYTYEMEMGTQILIYITLRCISSHYYWWSTHIRFFYVFYNLGLINL